MNKEQFVAVETEPWWFVEPEVDYGIEALRRELGVSLGWTDPLWYSERAKLEALYVVIERDAAQLLPELAYLSDDQKPAHWLGSVVDLTTPSPPQPNPAGAESPEAAAESAPTADLHPDAAPVPEDSGMAAQWDENWQMLFRAGPDGEYQFAFSDDGRTVRPGTGWLSQAEAAAALAETATAAQGSGTPSTGEQEQQTDEEVQAVMADLSSEALSGIASEVGVTPDELEAMVQDPEFARLVAEEEAKLAAGGG